jgi:hypothetical protein
VEARARLLLIKLQSHIKRAAVQISTAAQFVFDSAETFARMGISSALSVGSPLGVEGAATLLRGVRDRATRKVRVSWVPLMEPCALQFVASLAVTGTKEHAHAL